MGLDNPSVGVVKTKTRAIGGSGAACLLLSVATGIGFSLLTYVGCYYSGRLFEPGYPTTGGLPDVLTYWPFVGAAIWPLGHVALWVFTHDRWSRYYSVAGWLLWLANATCGCALAYFAWRPLATAIIIQVAP